MKQKGAATKIIQKINKFFVLKECLIIEKKKKYKNLSIEMTCPAGLSRNAIISKIETIKHGCGPALP